MNQLIRMTLALTAMLSLVLAGCGGDDEAPTAAPDSGSSPAASGGNAGATWNAKLSSGTTLAASVFVPATDPALAKFEELRKAAGAPEVLYAKVVARNRGSTADTARFLTLTGNDGKPLDPGAVVLNFACSLAARWAQTPGLPSSAISAYNGLYNIECRGQTALGPSINPGETFTYFVAAEGSSAVKFERVFVGASEELKK